jgi:hypothetical protein
MKQTQKKPGSFEQNFPANNKLSENFSVVISIYGIISYLTIFVRITIQLLSLNF